MARALDQLLDQYDKGQLDRRQLLKGLTLAIGGAVAGGAETTVEAQGDGMLPLLQINHINVMAKDVLKTAAWYEAVFGAKYQTKSPVSTLMSFPGATPTSGCWISIGNISRRPEYDNANGTPGVTHWGAGIKGDPADYPRIAAEVHTRFPGLATPNTPAMKNNPVGPYEAYLFDPEGNAIQLIRPEFDAAALRRG